MDSLTQFVEEGGGLLWAGGDVTVVGLSEPLLEEFGFERMWAGDSLPVRAAGSLWGMGAEAVTRSPLFLKAGDGAPFFVTLLESDSGAVALTFARGAGRVVAFADAQYFTNRRLRSSDNALAAVNAVAIYWPGRRVIFDEYHHGFSEGGRVPQTVLGFFWGHPLGWASLQLALAGLALLYLNGRRIGAPRPPRPPHRRSEVEHVEALAGAYGRAEAHRRAADLMWAGLRRRLGLRGSRGGPEDRDLWARLEVWLGRTEARERAARLRALAGAERLGERELVEWGQGIHDLEEEVQRRWRSRARQSSRGPR